MKYLALLLIFGFGISGFGQTIKSLGYNTTNGQVVANTGANTLTFTNRFGQFSTNATNPPEIRLTTKSNNVASWFVYDAIQTNPAAPNWSVAFMGLNTVPKSDGTDRALLNQSIGGASFTIENMWVSPTPDPDAPLAEFYFNITDTNNFTTRGFSVVGNQTNSTIGFADFTYPLTIFYNTNSRAWYGGDTLGLNVFSTNTGDLARFTHSTTNPSGTAQIYLQVQNNQTIWQSGLTTTVMRNFGSGRNVFRADSNGVIYGATGANDAPQAPIHLAGNTRVDGSITFNATSNAATTRTNLELGSTNNVIFRRLRMDATMEDNTTNATLLLTAAGTNTWPSIRWGARGGSGELYENMYMYAAQNNLNWVASAGFNWMSGPNPYQGTTWLSIASDGTITAPNATGTASNSIANVGTLDNRYSRITNGITTNRTFVSYNGTNYTTNTVTISNGIITGWTQ